MTTDETFTQDDVLAFARLSGDYNPMHTDPLQARREIYGRTVVHGMFALLRMLEHTLPGDGATGLSTLSARFLSPVFPDTPLTLLHSPQGYALHSGASRLITLQAELAPLSHPMPEPPPPPAAAPGVPTVTSIEQDPPSASLPIWLDTKAAQEIFPQLRLPARQLAELAALSRLVGMIYPGARSVFSQLNLKANPQPTDKPLSFHITRRDARFALVDMDIAGGCFTGSLRAFFRPAPYRQPAYAVLQPRASVLPSISSRVVVIGASRGIGEVTAKLAAAAGAEVLLTYRQGKADTDAIVGEIRKGGGHAAMAAYDVANPATLPGWARASHVFYFATPPVFQPRRDPYDAPLFERFKACYVDAFLRTAACFPEATLFYPSSVAIAEKPGFLPEYAATKFLGEQVCAALRRGGRRVIVERLPRIATDQTRTIGAAYPAADAAEIMLPILHQCFAAHRTARTPGAPS